MFLKRKPRIELNDDFNALVLNLDERFRTLSRHNAVIADTLTVARSVFVALAERETEPDMRVRLEGLLGNLDELLEGCSLMSVGLAEQAAVIATQKQQTA